ncbi:MAG TPA: hypothetical protein VMZ28_30030, partial [Kofleriaceae bacterium]|nr:hypothetical protein [Kofleriaceae bacterium]
MIPAAGREAWREVPAEPAAAAPPEFLPPEAFEDMLGTRVWRPEAVEAEPPRRRMPRGTPPQLERQPEPQPEQRAARQPARRTETALASLHEAAIRAPLARGKVQAKPPRPRRSEPAMDAQATIERPPPLDPRLLPPLPSPIPELRAPATHRPSAAHRVAAPPVYQAPSPPPYLAPVPPPYFAPSPPLRPAIFDHQPRRPSTAAAVEPPRFARFARPRTREGRVVHLAIAAAAVAAGIVLAAGYQVWAA